MIAGVRLQRRLAAPAGEETRPRIGELVDLSATRARVILVSALAPGTRVTLSLEPTAVSQQLHLTAEVRWCQPVPTGHAHGLVFAESVPELEDLLGPAAPLDQD